MKDLYDEWASPAPAYQAKKVRASRKQAPRSLALSAANHSFLISNVGLAIINGSLTFIILSMTPLDLSSVATSTILIVISSLAGGIACDRMFRTSQLIPNRRNVALERREERFSGVVSLNNQVNSKIKIQLSPLLTSLDRRLRKPPNRI
jgi:hypothetical protein